MMSSKGKSPKDWGILKKRNSSTGDFEWYARIVRVDGSGKKRQYTRKAENLTEARRLRDELSKQFEERGEKAIEGNKLTFRELAQIYQERRLHEAVYHGEGTKKRKISGVRSLQSSLHYLTVLQEHFGSKLIRNISHNDIEDFKKKRLQVRSMRGERSIADVNRTLEIMRAVLRFATRQGWLRQSPFDLGNPLISKADEVTRERVLSFDEEVRLLNQCVKRREHLRPLIITALDTAMRKGELLKLTWNSVDFLNGTITILAMNSKTSKERRVGMTKRVAEELTNLWEQSPGDLGALVFGITDTVKTSWASACKAANIEDLRFHDLRHSALTRMIQMGIPPMELMKISGHSQINTFARYINPDTGAVQRIAETLSTYQEKEMGRLEVSELVN